LFSQKLEFAGVLRTGWLFSPEIDEFRDAMRTTMPTKAWFDYAMDLNRIGLDRQAQTLETEKAAFAMHAIFVRTHQSFQAALLLIERGLIGDARTVLRSGVEGAIAIAALGADPAFVDSLVEAYHYHQRKIARVLLDNPDYHAPYGAEEIAVMQRVKDEIDAMETVSGRKLQDVNWADVAGKHCRDLYHLLYRLFSNDGVHTTLSTLDRYVEVDGNMRITAFKAAPDGVGAAEVLSGACLLFFWAADPFANTVGRPDVSAQLKDQLARFGTMPDAFPGERPAA
jgi:hypothetical protein